VADRDYVVWSTPEEMVRLGYKPWARTPGVPASANPRGACARAHRAQGRARLQGFQIYAAPDVTLEQDLARRDLTINALARDEAGRLIDPFGGAADLERGCSGT